MELKNVKYQFTVENTESKIPNLGYIGLFFPVNYFSEQNDCKTYFLYTTKIRPVEVNVNFLYPSETSENHIFDVSEGTKGNINPKWIKKQQYR